MKNEKVFMRMNYDMEEHFGRYFDDFIVGDAYLHYPGKTITESDNNLFSLITMNHHPLHLDRQYAERQQHGKILVVGTLIFSLVVGMTVSEISGKAIANLDYTNVKHLKPVFIGDTIRCKTQILDKKLSKGKPDRGIVHVKTIAYNQNDEIVLSVERHVIVPKRRADV